MFGMCDEKHSIQTSSTALLALFVNNFYLLPVHKIALQLGQLTITWYGAFVAFGFLAGIWTAGRRGLRNRIAPELVMDLGFWLFVGAILGARFLYVISYWRESFAGQPWWEIFMVHHGGLVYYGGLIGAIVSCLACVRIKKLALWKMADVLAPSIALGYFFGRFGCLMNGCCYGRQTDIPWGIQFPNGHETYPQHVHPTQIYDALLNLGLYIGLALLYRRRKFEGQVFAAYLIGYAVLRAFVEIFRGDYSVHYLGWATPAQLVSIGILLAGLILYWRLPKAFEVQTK
jgi:phosphatidylglycerol:prolipoprotein diacylglycerol transferase